MAWAEAHKCIVLWRPKNYTLKVTYKILLHIIQSGFWKVVLTDTSEGRPCHFAPMERLGLPMLGATFVGAQFAQ